MSYRLIITEKPSVAQAIAKALHVTGRKDGYMEGNGYLISWCFGHLVELVSADAYDEKYAKWNKKDLPIIPEEWKYQVTKEKAKQFKIVKSLMNRKDLDPACPIICATDCGREGENIFRNVYYQASCKKPFYRLWISSLEESAILDGFEHLHPGTDYDNLYQSAMARAKADWLVGINGTRLYTTLYDKLIRVGRVQTPVLSMICERYYQIDSFVKEPYWNVHVNCENITFSREKIKEKSAADQLKDQCNGKPVYIKSIESQKKSAAPPKLYDLTTLQREANRLFGYTAKQVLDTVQKLYEKKLCTYPRTDSRYITHDMEVNTSGLIRELIPNYSFSEYLITPFDSAPYQPDMKLIINDSKVSDHHAIIPTKEVLKADTSALSAQEINILHQIIMRLISATAAKQVYEDTLITAICEGETFTAKGRVIHDNGWKQIEENFHLAKEKKGKSTEDDSTDSSASTATLPPLKEGDIYNTNKTTLSTHYTTPPKPYTEDTLLAAMESAGKDFFEEDTEKKGLGTPATRAGILEKLVYSKYIQRKGKHLIPTKEGLAINSVVPDTLKSPSLTAEWENHLMQIEHGKMPAEEFIKGITGMVAGLIKTYGSISPEEKKQFMDNFTSTL